MTSKFSPTQPVMSVSARQRRQFKTPGPGSYAVTVPKNKKSNAFGKAGRHMTVVQKKSPGPKYIPNTSLTKPGSPNNRWGRQRRFGNDKALCPVNSYADSKTKCIQRPTSRFSKQRRFLKLKSQEDFTPGPYYKPSFTACKRNDKLGSIWGVSSEKRFTGLYAKPANKTHTYLGATVKQPHKTRPTSVKFGTARRGKQISPKFVTPAPKYDPRIEKESRRKKAPAAGWGRQTMPRFF